MMVEYRIYRFDGASRIEMAEWIEASDDDDAIFQTRQLANNSAKCELWHENRLIIALGRHDLARSARTNISQDI